MKCSRPVTVFLLWFFAVQLGLIVIGVALFLVPPFGFLLASFWVVAMSYFGGESFLAGAAALLAITGLVALPIAGIAASVNNELRRADSGGAVAGASNRLTPYPAGPLSDDTRRKYKGIAGTLSVIGAALLAISVLFASVKPRSSATRAWSAGHLPRGSERGVPE